MPTRTRLECLVEPKRRDETDVEGVSLKFVLWKNVTTSVGHLDVSVKLEAEIVKHGQSSVSSNEGRKSSKRGRRGSGAHQGLHLLHLPEAQTLIPLLVLRGALIRDSQDLSHPLDTEKL